MAGKGLTAAVRPKIPAEALRSWGSGWKFHPAEFAKRVIPFGEAGTPWELWKGPWPWQADFLNGIAAEMLEKDWGVAIDGEVDQKMPIQRAVSSCAGSGKTSFVLPFTMFWLMTVLPGIRCIMISTTREQLMDRLFKNTKLMWESSPVLQSIFGLVESGKVWRRDMENTCYATFRTAEKPEGMSGLHSPSGLTFVGFDESSGVSEAMREATSGACDDPQAIIVAVGNPYRNSGWFYRCHSGDLKDLWHPVHLARWDLPGWKEELRPQLIRRHGGDDTASYRAYVAGLPPLGSETAFIPMDQIRDSMSKKLIADSGEPVVPFDTPVVCGVDLAKSGSSYTCASFVAGLDGRIPPVMIQGKDLPAGERVDWFIRLLETPRRPYGSPVCVFFDATAGEGAQLMWDLERRGYGNGQFVPVNFAGRKKASQFSNTRGELWGGLKWWLGNGGMLPRDDKLADTIHAARASQDAYGRTEICPKEEIAKAAGRDRLDRLDSLMLACLNPPPGVSESEERREPVRRQAFGRKPASWMG